MGLEAVLKFGKTLEWAFDFHGHRCVLMPLGIRMGYLGLWELGVERAKDRDPVALLELSNGQAGACLADGIQIATGCTYGKGNIRKLQYGKYAVIFLSGEKRKMVRISLKPEIMIEIKASEFSKKRAMGVPFSKIPRELSDEIINKILQKSDEELFKVEPLKDYDYKEEPLLFRGVKCSRCGEIVAEDRARLVEGKPYCIPCSGYTEMKFE